MAVSTPWQSLVTFALPLLTPAASICGNHLSSTDGLLILSYVMACTVRGLSVIYVSLTDGWSRRFGPTAVPGDIYKRAAGRDYEERLALDTEVENQQEPVKIFTLVL